MSAVAAFFPFQVKPNVTPYHRRAVVSSLFNPPVGTTYGKFCHYVCLSVRFFEKFEDIYLFKGDIWQMNDENKIC